MALSHHNSKVVKSTMCVQEVFGLSKLSSQNYDEQAWFYQILWILLFFIQFCF